MAYFAGFRPSSDSSHDFNLADAVVLGSVPYSVLATRKARLSPMPIPSEAMSAPNVAPARLKTAIVTTVSVIPFAKRLLNFCFASVLSHE